MSKYLLLILCFFLLGGVYYTSTQLYQEELQTSSIQLSSDVNLPEYLTRDFEVGTYNASTHVFIGEATTKESKKIVEDNSRGFYTYVTVQVERYDKGEGEKEVIVRYEGGTVGNKTSVVSSSPHGTISITIGGKYVFFTNKVEENDNLYYTYYVKDI